MYLKNIILLTFLVISTIQITQAQDFEIENGEIHILGKELNGVLVPAILENQLGSLQISAPHGDGVQIKSGDHLTMKGGNISIDSMGDFIANKGGKLRLKSPNNAHGMYMDHSDFNEFQMMIDGSPNIQLLLNMDNRRWGVFSASPDSELDILQQNPMSWGGYNSRVSTKAGLTIKNTGGLNVTMGIDQAADLIFAFNGFGQAYISDSNGKYFNASNPSGLARSTSQKAKGSMLSKIKDLNLYASQQKSGSKGLQVDGHEVQRLFPEITSEKNGEVGICYADFGLIAIKAIQELENRIEQLENRNEELFKLSQDLLSKTQSN